MVALRIAAAFLLAGVPGPAASAAAETIRMEPVQAVPGQAAGAVGTALPPGGDRMVVNVQPGQTVSMIIRQHYRDSPFNERFVGRVLAEMNPGAFVRGSPHRLVAGTRLVLPSMQELAGSMAAAPVAPEPIAMRMPTAPAPIEPVQAGVEARVEVRPRWIRYP
jgi:Tfp pilus assembly protein FimV